MRALLVFGDPKEGRRHWLAPLLKHGFGHVSAVVLTGDYWVLLDAQRGVPVVQVVCGADFDIAGHYRSEGYTVVETVQRAVPARAPVMQANCVGLVKALLCIRSAAQTPWQLYRHIQRSKQGNQNENTTGVRRCAVAAKS